MRTNRTPKGAENSDEWWDQRRLGSTACAGRPMSRGQELSRRWQCTANLANLTSLTLRAFRAESCHLATTTSRRWSIGLLLGFARSQHSSENSMRRVRSLQRGKPNSKPRAPKRNSLRKHSPPSFTRSVTIFARRWSRLMQTFNLSMCCGRASRLTKSPRAWRICAEPAITASH